MIKADQLIPVRGCWVQHKIEDRLGSVIDGRVDSGIIKVLVLWRNTKSPVWVKFSEIKSGLKVGSEVEDVPFSRTRKSNGIGVVRSKSRIIGLSEQHLIDFEETGYRTWMPFETLRFVQSVRHQFDTRKSFEKGSAERFRLRNLAYAIEFWHENTGSLTHLNIDPLPHQIHLVHHILKSGDLNWMIADDVGLGKTIEVGMLLSALKSKREFDRVLLVCPAGLVKQWKDEMYFKFGISDFQIYGEDFQINEIRDWRLHNKVIASLDLLKGSEHLKKIMAADSWGLIIFDEAHRLSRSRYGFKYDTSERFRLAQSLRKKTDSLILLSATPHQGKQDKFQALLELLHPEWKSEIDTLDFNPQILANMVIRNNKSDVTDSEGNFIFKGKVVKSISIDFDENEKNFDISLMQYLQAGYQASVTGQSNKLKAIGFVMTVYRKLAASSMAAIYGALHRRLSRLVDQENYLSTDMPISELNEDDPFGTEVEEEQVIGIIQSSKSEFFAGEIESLRHLIQEAEILLESDKKIQSLMNMLIPEILRSDPEKKVLIFTEYKATQEYIARAIANKFGNENVALIHGGMSHSDRQVSIDSFEAYGQFLISTEAGGEGINLQRKCHVMINYDLPWNPMRLVQRVGRLYRYGQPKPVIVFNLQAPHTFDGKILQIMYERIQQVVVDMAPIGEDFSPGLEDEILGQISDLVDMEDILGDAISSTMQRTESRIAEALKKAKDATNIQRSLFEHFNRFDPDEIKNEFKISNRHIMSFVKGMLEILGVEIQHELYKGDVLEIKLTADICEQLGLRATILRICFNREYSNISIPAQVMDESSPLLRYMINLAKNYRFNANVAVLKNLPFKAVLTAVVRWQNDQGRRSRQEYLVVGVKDEKTWVVNPLEFSNLLLEHQEDGILSLDIMENSKIYRAFCDSVFDDRLAEISNVSLHPENRQLISASWVQIQ